MNKTCIAFQANYRTTFYLRTRSSHQLLYPECQCSSQNIISKSYEFFFVMFTNNLLNRCTFPLALGLSRPAAMPGMESSKSSQSLPSPSPQQQQHMALSINTSASPSATSTGANSARSASGGGLADARNSAGSVSIQMQTLEPLDMPHQQSSLPSSRVSVEWGSVMGR